MKIFLFGMLSSVAIFAVIGVAANSLIKSEKTIEHCVTTCK